MAFEHHGFWQPMDTLREKNFLDRIVAVRQSALEGVVMGKPLLRLPASQFWSGKRVLLTGHTGFKGSWLALWLAR